MSFRFAQAKQRGASGFSFTQSSGQGGTNMAADNSNRDDDIDTKMAAGVFTCIGEKESRERFTDLTVVVQDVKFRSHRFILSACSKFFEALLRTDMKETSEGTVALGGMEPEIFSLILDVLYTGANVFTTENMFDLWHAANQLQIDFLINACEGFMIKILTPSNCWTVYSEATKLDSPKVLRDIRRYLAVNFADIVVSDSFMCLSLDDMIGILQYQHRTVCTDFSVFCLLRWACAETDSIRVLFKADNPFMSRMLNHQRTQDVKCILQKLSPVDTQTLVYKRSCLSQLLEKVDLTQASSNCLTYLMTNEFVADHRDAILRVNRASVQRIDSSANLPNSLGSCKHCTRLLVYK